MTWNDDSHNADLYTWALRDLIASPPEELLRLNAVIDQLVAFAGKARREGWLSFDGEVDELPIPSMALGLRLVVDAVDPAEITRILRIRVVTSGHTGPALVQDLLVMEGVLAIQRGLNPEHVRTLLTSVLGPVAERLEEERRRAKPVLSEPRGTQVAAQLATLGTFGPRSDRTNLIEGLAEMSSDRVEAILRELDAQDIITSLKGAGSGVWQTMLGAMSPRAAELMLAEVEQYRVISEDSIRKAQKKSVKLLKAAE